MSRWTAAQKEWQGYKRKMANGQETVSLSQPPWEKKDGTLGSDKRSDQENTKADRRYRVGEPHGSKDRGPSSTA